MGSLFDELTITFIKASSLANLETLFERSFRNLLTESPIETPIASPIASPIESTISGRRCLVRVININAINLMRNVRVFTRGNVFVLLEHTPNPYTPYAGVYGVKRVYAILSIDSGLRFPYARYCHIISNERSDICACETFDRKEKPD